MRRPHIVFITTDQQRSDTIHAWDCPYAITPHLDQLVQQGVSFRSAFAPGASSSASRGAMFTGMNAHTTGVFSQNVWAQQRTWVEDLAESGYRCVSIGKLGTAPDIRAPAGFHERIVVENTSSSLAERNQPDDDWGRFLALHGQQRPNQRHLSDPNWLKKCQAAAWHLDEQLHPDVFIANSAVAWITSHSPAEPIFLHIGFSGPHEPYDPLPRHLDLYKDIQIPAAVFRDNELDKKPPSHRQHQQSCAERNSQSKIDLLNAEPGDVAKMRKHYFAKVTTIDEKIGDILKALKEKGFAEDTIIVVASDHGDMLGDHRMAYAGFMYECVVRVPLIIVDNHPGRTAKKIDHLVSLIDIGPTILGVAGVQVPPHLEGHSLLPHVRGGQVETEDVAFAEEGNMVMIRNRRNKMVLYIGESYGELYDLKRDPLELVNLWDDGTLAPVKADLKNRILNWLLKSNFATASYKIGRIRRFHRPRPPGGRPGHSGPYRHR